MPTGYTADVKDGKVTDLTDFVLTCARGFGALVALRDSDQSLEATRRYIEDEAYLIHSSYYADEITAAQARIAELEAMDEREALAAAQEAADAVVQRNREYAETRLVERERYEAMLAKVEAWDAPSTHYEFKTFMVKQIEQSIEFDCRAFAMSVPEVSLGWRDAELETQRRRIARAEEEIENERHRNESRKAWVTALLDSLEGVSSVTACNTGNPHPLAPREERLADALERVLGHMEQMYQPRIIDAPAWWQIRDDAYAVLREVDRDTE